MHIVKNLARGSASALFKLLIFLLAVVAAIVLTLHSPKKIEKSLRDSGVYSTFVDSALQEVQKSNTSSSGNTNVPIADPAIKAAAKQAFTPELLQRSTENVLNGTYNWLAGKTAVPVFRIDLSGAKQSFAQAVGVAAAQRMSTLPACTTAQLQQLSPNQDPFSLVCLPPGFDVAAAQAKLTNDIATSKEFLGTTVITPQSLPKNSTGKTVYDQLAEAPKIYKWVNASPWLLAVLALVGAAISVALHDSRRRGLRNIATALIGSGIFLMVIGYLDTFLIGRINRPGGLLGKSLQGSFQQTGIKAINSIGHSVILVMIRFGAVYIVVGGVMLLVLRLTKPKKPIDTKDDKAKSKPEEPPKIPVTPAAKQKPAVQ